MEGDKIPLFAEYIILYLKYPKHTIRKTLEVVILPSN